MSEKTKAELQAALEALVNEAKEIQSKLDQVKDWEQRLRSLKNGWHSTGEIEMARRAVRDADFPIFREKRVYQGAVRIIAVDDKWITLRYDGAADDGVTKYRRKDGMEGQRKKWGETINVEAALKTWAEHQQSQPATESEAV